MGLSNSQENARNEFLKFLDSDEQEFTISGPAGSGKTYLVRHLLDIAYSENKLLRTIDDTEQELAIHLTATTHKAVDVLSRSVPEFECKTIYSLLNLRVQPDFKTGKTSLIKEKGYRAKTTDLNNSIVVIDEASMVGSELYSHIQNMRRVFQGVKIIYIGDKYQLPPVLERASPVFTRVKRLAQLTEIQRQSEVSTIIPVAQALRDTMDTAGLWPTIETSKNITLIDKPDVWLQTIDQAFLNAEDRESVKVLAWTNKHVRNYNDRIMETLGIEDPLSFGNVLVTNNRLDNGSGIVFETDSRVVICSSPVNSSLRIKIKDPNRAEPEEIDIPTRWVRIADRQNRKICDVHTPQDWDEVNGILKRLAKLKDWRTYFTLQERMADLRPFFSQTVHKSQGSTYKVAFVDLQNISRNNKWLEVAQLVYTGMTRAADHVYFYGHLPEKWTKEKKESLTEVFTYVNSTQTESEKECSAALSNFG